MDVDTLNPSDHFATRIEKAIATADVMLVLIGPTWVAQADRLASRDDFIRREILLAALRVECRLVPVCLDGAAMPDAAPCPRTCGRCCERRRRAAATASSSATPTTSPTRWRPSCARRPRRRGAACRWRCPGPAGRCPGGPAWSAGRRRARRWPSRRCRSPSLGAHGGRRLVARPAGRSGRLHPAPGDRQRRQGDGGVPDRHGHRRGRPHASRMPSSRSPTSMRGAIPRRPPIRPASSPSRTRRSAPPASRGSSWSSASPATRSSARTSSATRCATGGASIPTPRWRVSPSMTPSIVPVPSSRPPASPSRRPGRWPAGRRSRPRRPSAAAVGAPAGEGRDGTPAAARRSRCPTRRFMRSKASAMPASGSTTSTPACWRLPAVRGLCRHRASCTRRSS